jgi:hypothetical protein
VDYKALVRVAFVSEESCRFYANHFKKEMYLQTPIHRGRKSLGEGIEQE